VGGYLTLQDHHFAGGCEDFPTIECKQQTLLKSSV
jgi:hypothetical protein